MPIYEWTCGYCKTLKSVFKSMSRRNEPPDECSACRNTAFNKAVSIPQRFSGGTDPFPCKINGQLFTSKSHQAEWMNRNGYSLLADWTDPTHVGKGHFDKGEADSAPSSNAETILSNTSVLTSDEVKEQFNVEGIL